MALFSLPRLTQNHDQSLGPHDDAEYSDRDAIPKGCQWIRDDCGHGWSIVSRKRTTFIALAFFLNLCRIKSHTRKKPYPLVPLLAALEQVDEKLVQLLCAQGKDFIPGGPNGISLQKASKKGHEGIVRLLLNYKADVDAQTGPYGNALQRASAEDRESIIQLLRNYEADFHAPYGSVLQEAPSNVRDYIVELLLSHKADINAQGGPYGSALQAASFMGHDQIVHLLLSHKADVNAPGEPYGSALQAASLMGRDQTVHLLLSRKADVNAPGGPYGSALQVASFMGHDQTVQLLLSHKADVNAPGGTYGSALQAAAYNGFTNIMRRLLDSGADGNVQDLGYAFITVSVDDRDHKFLQRLLDAVRHLKQRIIKEIPSVLETLTADPTRSVRLIIDGKTHIDEMISCMEAGLWEGSHVSCLIESGSTGTEAQA